jgi:hypothetical protein
LQTQFNTCILNKLAQVKGHIINLIKLLIGGKNELE